MGSYRLSANVICPYYIRESERSVTCEGLREGMVVKSVFCSEQQKSDYQREMCVHYDYAELCPLARALFFKYSGGAE